MEPNKNLKPGDRVVIDVAKVEQWIAFNPKATIWSTWQEHESGAGSNYEQGAPPEEARGSYDIRFDDYDYGFGASSDTPGEGNSHMAHWSIIRPDEPSDSEVAEALASIANAARRDS